MTEQKLSKISESFNIDPNFQQAFKQLDITSIDSVFSFHDAVNLTKDSLASYRQRLQFQINFPSMTLFLKRYNYPPRFGQIKNWLAHRKRQSLGDCDCKPANQLNSVGINTAKTIAFGTQWGLLFEKRSFCITEKIPNAESLERKLPICFDEPLTSKKTKKRRDFIAALAVFIKKFHQTGFRHRDLYFSHIFYDSDGNLFYLIDLARVFKPKLLAERFRVKDIAQLYYSAPGRFFSKSDRLRFYHTYTGRTRLTQKDKHFIRKVKNKVKQMARHDKKHNRIPPFAN